MARRIRQPVKIREGSIEDLIALYQKTYAKIIQEIVTASEAGKIQRARVLSRINFELEQLGIDVNEWVKKEIPQYYLDGANIAQQDLRALGVDISKTSNFAAINKEAIQALTDEVALNFANAITGLSRNANIVLSDTLKQQLNFIIAEGKLTGETRKVISGNLKNRLEQEGIASLTDKSGRSWSLDRYTRMLARTKAVEARNQGLTNRMLTSGYDLVQVTDHGSQHAECAAWEGEILSLTGDTPGYPTLDEAEGAGLFHPNCEHAINVVVPYLAEKTTAYDNPFNNEANGLEDGQQWEDKVLTDIVKQRPEDSAQKAMEDALNAGDLDKAQKVVDGIKDQDLKDGLQATINALRR